MDGVTNMNHLTRMQSVHFADNIQIDVSGLDADIHVPFSPLY